MNSWKEGYLADLIKSLEQGVSVNSIDDNNINENTPLILKTSCVSAGFFDPTESKKIHPKDLGKQKLNPIADSILISRMNTPALVGASAYVNKTYKNIFLPDRLWMAVKKHDEVCMEWLSQIISSDYYWSKIRDRATGTSPSMKNISKKDLLKLPILIPSYAEQLEISKALKTWEAAIEKTESLIYAKERQFVWLQSKLFRTVLENYKDNIKLLADVCKIITGKKDVNQGNPDGQYPFFTCAKDHTFSDSYSYDMEAILLAGNGYIGNPILYSGKFEAYQRAYILYEFTQVDAQYLNYLLRRNLQKKIAKEKQEGVMSYIKLGTLQSLEIVVPSLEEQKRIANVLNIAQREITLLKKLAKGYRTQKRGLMQKLLSGRWHIKNKEGAA